MRHNLIFPCAALILLAPFVPRVMASGALTLEYVPGGTFSMGDASPTSPGQGLEDERPAHAVVVAPYYIESIEVTETLWDTVRTWALTNGYPDLPTSAGGETNGIPPPNYPVTGVSWYDCVKWCNARSEMDGLIPAYRLPAQSADIYRIGESALSNTCVRSDANGYRLPTEVEWERAARGGLAGQFYPWQGLGGFYADHLDKTLANYSNSNGTAAVAATGTTNAYRLYDMAGNVSEWCWDWYGPDQYAVAATNETPRTMGPEAMPLSAYRIVRGGSWASEAFEVRCAFRDVLRPANANDRVGFRCVRGFTGNEHIDRDADGMPDWWEVIFFAHPTNAPPTGNADGDRFDNLAEWIADTDPTDPTSVFSVEGVSHPGGESVIVSWRSTSNRLYSIIQSTNPHNSYEALATNIPATPPCNSYTDTIHRTSKRGFYRVRVRPID